MQTAAERREEIRNYISVHRSVTRQELADRFGVSTKTIQRDIAVLQSYSMIDTAQGGAGGIKAIDGWKASDNHLTTDQQALLEKLLPTLEGKDQETMKEILRCFGKTAVKERVN